MIQKTPNKRPTIEKVLNNSIFDELDDTPLNIPVERANSSNFSNSIASSSSSGTEISEISTLSTKEKTKKYLQSCNKRYETNINLDSINVNLSNMGLDDEELANLSQISLIN